MTYRILLIEDQSLVRTSLTALLNGTGEFIVADAFDECGSALRQLGAGVPYDVIVCDYHLRHETGERLLRLSRDLHRIPIVLLTSLFNAMALQRCLSLGAKGFLFKECPLEEFLRALRLVIAGGVYFATPEPVTLSPREESPSLDLRLTEIERNILKWLATGMSNKQIAIALGKSSETVKTQVSHLLRKLGSQTRTQAVSRAIHLNLLP